MNGAFRSLQEGAKPEQEDEAPNGPQGLGDEAAAASPETGAHQVGLHGTASVL